jgi:hypothetical protein
MPVRALGVSVDALANVSENEVTESPRRGRRKGE